MCVQKRDSGVLAGLRQTCLQGGPWTGVWGPGFGGCAHHSFMYKRLTEPRLSVQTMRSMLNTCVPSGSLAFWHMLGRRWLRDQPPIRSLGAECLRSFPGEQHLGSVPQDSTAEDSWERTPASSGLCPSLSPLLLLLRVLWL